MFPKMPTHNGNRTYAAASELLISSFFQFSRETCNKFAKKFTFEIATECFQISKKKTKNFLFW